MATYPDAIIDIPDRTDLVDTVEAAHVNVAYDEIEAIEAELGVKPRGSHSSVADRLDALEARDHGDLDGKSDDDHPQYATFAKEGSVPEASRNGRLVRVGNKIYWDDGISVDLVGTTAHSDLTGSGSGDPHPQYFAKTGGQFGNYTEQRVSANVSGTYTPSGSNNFDLTVTGNVTISVPDGPGGSVWSNMTFLIKQGGSGGYTVTFQNVKWPNGVPPAFPTNVGEDILITLLWDGTNWRGIAAGGYFA